MSLPAWSAAPSPRSPAPAGAVRTALPPPTAILPRLPVIGMVGFCRLERARDAAGDARHPDAFPGH